MSDRLLLSFRWFNCLAEIILIFGRNKLCPLFVNFAIRHNPFLPLAWPTKRGREQSVERVSTNLLPATFLCIGHTSKVWISARQFFRFFFFDIFSFLGSGSKSRIIVVGEVGAIQVMINSSPDYLRHLRLVWQSRRKSTRLPIAASPKGWLRTFPLPSLSPIGGFYPPTSLRFFYLIVWHAIRFFTFPSESVSFPFTSISMQSPPYRIRWLSPFRRKGNSGMLRCCKVGAFGFGENLHACAPLRFASGSIFPQKPYIRLSLPLLSTWNENDRCDRKTH